MEESLKQEYIIKISRKFYDDCVAMYLIDNENHNYDTIKSADYLENIIAPSGSLKDLYRTLLFNDTDGKVNSDTNKCSSGYE